MTSIFVTVFGALGVAANILIYQLKNKKTTKEEIENENN